MTLVINKRFGCCYLFEKCGADRRCRFLDSPEMFGTPELAMAYAGNCRHFPGGFGSNFQGEVGGQPPVDLEKKAREWARKWLESNPEE